MERQIACPHCHMVVGLPPTTSDGVTFRCPCCSKVFMAPPSPVAKLGLRVSAPAEASAVPVQATLQPVARTKVFISYRRDDSGDIAGRLYDCLVRTYGSANVFKDVDSIPLGADFRAELDAAVGRCEVLLALIGRDWLHITGPSGARRLDDPDDFVRLEIEAALRRGIPVIPVLVGGATIPRSERLPAPLQPLVFRHGIELRRDPDFHRDVERLLQRLNQLIPPSTEPPPLAPAAQPLDPNQDTTAPSSDSAPSARTRVELRTSLRLERSFRLILSGEHHLLTYRYLDGWFNTADLILLDDSTIINGLFLGGQHTFELHTKGIPHVIEVKRSMSEEILNRIVMFQLTIDGQVHYNEGFCV
jgi:hypothetical protein